MADNAEETGSRGAKRQPGEEMADRRTGKKVKAPSHQDLRKHPIAIRVGVGLESETFHCFVALLRRTSLFFRDQLSEPKLFTPQLEILTRLDLPSDVPAIFARYHEWLDKDRLWTTTTELELLRPYDLAQLFCFAERIQAPRFKNVIIDTFHARTRLVTRQITTNNEDGPKQNHHDVFSSYYRAARWISANAEADSAIYTYIVDFFAYFVLQTVPSSEHKVLDELPTSFLWQVQNAVTAALQRHVPGGPPPLPAHRPTATATAPIRTDDSPEDEASAVPTPTPSQLRATALISLPKPDLVQSILVGSATLRMLAKTALQKQVKAAEKPANSAEKKGTKGKREDDGGRPSVFGVDDLCKYHIHSDRPKAAACTRAFASRVNVQGVWVCGLVMREVEEGG